MMDSHTLPRNKEHAAGAERRLHPRFSLPRCHVYSGGERMHLLNLGRSGMAIESFGRCNFSRSEDHRFVLDDEKNSIEVVGNVSWVSSSWVDAEQVPGTGLVQTVGVSFREVVSPYRVGLWRGIESWVIPSENTDHELVPLVETPAIQARPPALMESPRDGDSTTERFITVEGRLREPKSVSRVRINDVEATVDGARFTARVHLTRNVNYLCAVVSHWNTIDSTCFLGKVVRQLEAAEASSDLKDPSPLRQDLGRAAAEVLVLPDLPDD